MPEQRQEQSYQGREFTTTIQANTEEELDMMIKSLHDYAKKMGIEDFEVLQRRPDPDGGYEATIKAHNWNGFKWLKDKFAGIRERRAERGEEHRQKELDKLEAERKGAEEKTSKARAELEGRRRRKEEKEKRKREVKEARERAERARREQEEVKRELRREKYAGFIKAGEVAGKASEVAGRVVGKTITSLEQALGPDEKGRGISDTRRIGGEKYYRESSAARKEELGLLARDLRASGKRVRVLKIGKRFYLFCSDKTYPVRHSGGLRISGRTPQITPAMPKLR